MPIAAVCGSSTHAIRGTWKMRSSGFGTSKDAEEKSFWYLYSIGHFFLPAYRTITTRRRKMTRTTDREPSNVSGTIGESCNHLRGSLSAALEMLPHLREAHGVEHAFLRDAAFASQPNAPA